MPNPTFRYIWGICEGGKIESLVSGLDKSSLIRGLQTQDALSKGDQHDKIKQLIEYWKDGRGSNNVWAAKFYLCELLTIANVFGQLHLTNFFLDGEFQRIAMQGLNLEENDSVLPVLAECRLSL